MGPGYRLRWAVRQPRFWGGIAAWLLVTLLAAADRKSWWTGYASTMAFWLTVLMVRAKYAEDHPGSEARAEERERAKLQADVDRILARFAAQRGWPAPPPRAQAVEPVPEEQPGEPAPEEAAGEEVAAEGVAAKRRPSRREAREQARVDELLAKYEAERVARAKPPGRHAERR